MFCEDLWILDERGGKKSVEQEGKMISDFVWLLVMLVEFILAAVKAIEGDVAFTVLYCFAAYCCLQFMEKNKEGK